MEKNKIQSNVLKATTWYMISSILLRGVSIFTAPLFTRMLSTEDYGIASNFSSWASIMTCIAGLGLPAAALRGKVEYKENFKSFLSSIQCLGFLSTSLCAVIILVLPDFWSRLMELDKGLILFMLAYVILNQSVGFAQIDYQFDYKYRQNIGISIINSIATVFFSVAFILIFSETKYIGRILGLSLPCTIMGLFFFIRIFRSGKCAFNREYWNYALKLSLPMIPHGLATIVLGQVDRIMIVKYCGGADAGIYSFGYSYAVLLAVITNAVSDGIKPQMYKFLEMGADKRLSAFMKKIVAGASVLTLLIIAMTPEALKILGTRDFYNARWIVFPVAIGTLMQFMYQNFTIVELYFKKTIYTAVGSVTAAIVNIILNYFFIPRYGFIAAAYTTMISYGLLMWLHYFASCIAAKRKVYSIVPYINISVFTCAIGGLLNLLFDRSSYLRYALILLVVFGAAIFYKKELRYVAQYIKRKGSK